MDVIVVIVSTDIFNVDINLDQFVDTWIVFNEMDENDPQRQQHWPAVSEVMNWNWHHPERLWQFIQLTYKRDISQKVKANLAAGPLEDLLSKHAQEFIDRVMQLALEDERFNYLLGGVWQNTMSDEIWQAIKNVRKSIW